mgnify:CR=1 FL=1
MINSRGLAFAYAGAPALRFPDLQAPQGAVVLLHWPLVAVIGVLGPIGVALAWRRLPA